RLHPVPTATAGHPRLGSGPPGPGPTPAPALAAPSSRALGEEAALPGKREDAGQPPPPPPPLESPAAESCLRGGGGRGAGSGRGDETGGGRGTQRPPCAIDGRPLRPGPARLSRPLAPSARAGGEGRTRQVTARRPQPRATLAARSPPRKCGEKEDTLSFLLLPFWGTYLAQYIVTRDLKQKHA
uniref:Uncharacterized protein n=1 Tax=Mustela putorius furo TaxID=9669 RepID=M3YU70_MUSPF